MKKFLTHPRYEFERDIAKGAVNKRTGQVVAERMLRYIEDKVRAKDTLVGKLRLKNSTLRSVGELVMGWDAGEAERSRWVAWSTCCIVEEGR